MNPPSSPPDAPTPPAPPPPPGRKPPRPALAIGVGIAAVVGVLAALLVIRDRARTSTTGTPSAPSSTAAAADTGPSVLQALPPASDQPRKVNVPSEAVRPSFWVDVYSPARVRDALGGNAWIQEQLRKPLGQGFVGGWAALLGSRGEDLGAGFKGAVFELVAGQLLSAPFRVVWFAGNNRTGTPALLVPEPGNKVMAAFDGMDKAVRREVLTAEGCPGGQGEVPSAGFTMHRWLVAEQSLWAARTDDRMVFGKTAAVVLQGLCEPHLDLEPPENVDVELGFSPETLGRAAQSLTHVMGVSQGIRLQFAAEGQRLVGRGITGPVADEPGLDSAPLTEDLLKLIPEQTPVLLTLQLKLPEKLDTASLKAFWAGGGMDMAVRTRQIALLWTPRGDEQLPTEVALAWGRPEDEEALLELFSGPNHLERETLCGHHVLASTPEQLDRIRGACKSQTPSLLQASPAVVSGLLQKGSIAFGLHTGALLSGLMTDGYVVQQSPEERLKPPLRALPPEIEAARRDMATLPYIGLRGTVDGNRLVPGGFGS